MENDTVSMCSYIYSQYIRHYPQFSLILPPDVDMMHTIFAHNVYSAKPDDPPTLTQTL